MDVWQLIARDHANITQLIHETPNALNSPGVVRSRERLLGDLIDELETHAAAVDASLHAPLSREAATRPLVGELRHEHQEFMQELHSLDQIYLKNSVGWLNRFEDTTTLVDQPLYRHSRELIPAARDLLGPEEVRNATRMYARAKVRYFDGRKHQFEHLAARIAAEVLRSNGLSYVEGWLTRAGGDGGLDFVGRLDVGSGPGSTPMIVLGQAKCVNPQTSISPDVGVVGHRADVSTGR